MKNSFFFFHQMNPKIRIFLFCPVPENQKPITDFILLQETPFFDWVTFSKKNSEEKVVWLAFLLILTSFFLLLFSSFFPISSFRSFFFICNAFLFILFFTLFSRGFQVKKRFQNSRLFYEEGSWYEGQIWEKPLSLIKNEKLILTQKIQPLLERISYLIIVLFLTTPFSFLLFFFPSSFF